VFIKTREKVSPSAQPSSSTITSQSTGPSADDKAKAEKLKQTGNAQMSNKDYDDAIESYNQAVALDPTNPVYYSNRAAAYSSKGDHLSAVGDAEKAISVDPNFIKAYHRLGYVLPLSFYLFDRAISKLKPVFRHAQYSLGDFKAAASAFERGLKLDPTSAALKSGLSNARARITDDNENSPSNAASTRSAPGAGAGAGLGGMGGMADMLRNIGGGAGGGAGGMPDLASMMNNPQLMAMAQQMAANGGLANLMQNPAVANMVRNV